MCSMWWLIYVYIVLGMFHGLAGGWITDWRGKLLQQNLPLRHCKDFSTPKHRARYTEGVP